MPPIPSVLHVMSTAHEQGASICRIVQTFAALVDPQQYRVTAWFLGGEGPLANDLRNSGIPVRTFSWNARRNDVAGAWRFWRALRHESFQIVHLHFGGRAAPLLVRLAGRAKIVLHVHYNGAEAGRVGPTRIRPWMADGVVTPSAALAANVVGMKARVVYHGITPRVVQRKHDDRDAMLLGVASRLVPVKGIVYLIRAVALLRRDCPGVHLEIVGAGSEQAALQSEVHALGLGDAVTFAGWQPDVWPWLARWDIFVQPSLAEGFGMATLEAMEAGLPVVGSAVGGLSELIDDGVTGYIVPAGHEVALAERLRDLVLHVDRRRAMGAAGHARARQFFSAERMTRELTQIYDELLGSQAGQAAATHRPAVERR